MKRTTRHKLLMQTNLFVTSTLSLRVPLTLSRWTSSPLELGLTSTRSQG